MARYATSGGFAPSVLDYDSSATPCEVRHRSGRRAAPPWQSGGRVSAGRERLDPVTLRWRHADGRVAAETPATLRDMDIFKEIENAFTNHRASGRIEEALDAWRVRQPGLGDEGDLDVLVRRCRGPEAGTQAQRDRILVALCREACGEQPDELAGVLLCWLLLPGLLQQVGELARGRSSSDREDLAAELLAGMWEAAARIEASSTHVARHLLRCGRRQALRMLKGSRAVRDGRSVEDAPDDRELPDEMVDDRLARAVDAGVLGAEQVELVLATRESIARVAARWGMTLVAAQQARHRARLRLRAWLEAS